MFQGPSDSESLSDSSISGAEETQNEADETNQDDLTSSSPPTTPSPVESDKDKATPVPIPVESTISGEKLAELPRPEPQHPSPPRQPIVSSPLVPPQIPIGGPLTSISSHIPQSFVPLPPLPAFVFRPQGYPPPSESLYPQQPPVSEKSPSASDSETKTISSVASTTATSSSSSTEPRETTVISVPKIKEEVISPPQSPQKVAIKQEPRESINFMSNIDQNVASAKPNSESYAAKDLCPLVTPKIEPGLGNPFPSSADFSSSVNQGQTDMTLSSQAQVKGHSEEKSEGDKGERSLEGERSEVEVMSDSDTENRGTPSPGPDPTPCNIEIHRTTSAM